MDWSTAQRDRRDCFHDAAWVEYLTQPRVREGGPPDHRGQLVAGADPDPVPLANGDLELRWTCDATDVSNT